MDSKTPVVFDHKKRVEKVVFHFDNLGDVEIEVPVLTCERTQTKFFHSDDVDFVLEELDKEYERIHKKLKK